MALWTPTAARMAAQVATWQACGDRRVIFLDCYLRMTRNMLAALDAGDFADAAWVAHLLDRFAAYYFNALTAYEQGEATPAVWRVAHDAARRPTTLTLQHLFLGVNAHINYDLVLVVAELLHPEWSQLTAAQRRQRYADYTHVNAIIARTIDEVQDEIVEPATPALRIVDLLLGPLDEWATVHLIAGWREEVWQHAVAILTAADAASREALRSAVETRTLRRAAWVLADPDLH
ncbi:MAG TPA: hypothetical protein GYA08_06140 [Chloroflexi bacterium]|nr:hypothetical protein [Chloroflexota bacterium]